MRLLDADPNLTQRELARDVGLSAGAIHYALNALVDKGFVKFSNFTAAPDKRRYAYLLTPKGMSEKTRLTRRFLARKIAEARTLQAEIAQIYEELEASAGNDGEGLEDGALSGLRSKG